MRQTALLLMLFVCAAPLHAGAFEFHWPDARAAGIGGACVAIVNPSAVSCNPGALPFLPKKKGKSGGLTFASFNESLYQGLPPGIGAGTAAEQETPLGLIPHLYVALPFPLLGQNAVLGTGIYYPYRMRTEWSEPDAFAGRFLATESEVEAIDFTTAWSTKLTPAVGIGVAAVYRSSSVSATRRFAVFSGTQREVGNLEMKSDTERTLGWSAGVLVQPSASLSFGATYHSAIATDYNGSGSLTQIATGDTQFDQLIRSTLPFDQDLPVTTKMKFPSQMNFGVTFSPSKAWMFALDVSRTNWGETDDDVELSFPANGILDTAYPLAFESTTSFRTGVRFRFATGPQLRLGYAVDNSPQPDVTVGPFLPDSDKTTMTAGFGLDWLDVAVGWTTYKQRIITTNSDGFNGNYRANSWVAMMTITK